MNDRLEDLVKRLPRHFEPERDLWPGIAAQLRPRRRGTRRPGLYRFAAGLAAVALALGGYFVLRPAAPPARNSGTATQSQAAPDPEAVISRNLEVVNSDIARITAALQRDPDNPVLYHFLDEAYRHQNRLMLERTKLTLSRSNTS